ncbi:MAG: hypothetical protein AAF649_10885 [Verrucomicrobiota bacterium]
MRLIIASLLPILMFTITIVFGIGCSTTDMQQPHTPERLEIHFSTQGSSLKPVAEFLDIHTQTPRRPAETGTKVR